MVIGDTGVLLGGGMGPRETTKPPSNDRGAGYGRRPCGPGRCAAAAHDGSRVDAGHRSGDQELVPASLSIAVPMSGADAGHGVMVQSRARFMKCPKLAGRLGVAGRGIRAIWTVLNRPPQHGQSSSERPVSWW